MYIATHPSSPTHTPYQARDMAADLDISLDDLSSDRMLTNLVHLVQVPTVTHMAATVLQYVAEQDACDRLRLVKQGVLEAVGAVLGEGVGENGGSDGSGGSGEGGGSDEAKAAVCGRWCGWVGVYSVYMCQYNPCK